MIVGGRVHNDRITLYIICMFYLQFVFLNKAIRKYNEMAFIKLWDYLIFSTLEQITIQSKHITALIIIIPS